MVGSQAGQGFDQHRKAILRSSPRHDRDEGPSAFQCSLVLFIQRTPLGAQERRYDRDPMARNS